MKIYLVGMPGSGKTTLGRQLAAEMMMLFTDLDKEIEKREKKSVSEIFAQQGEDHFRLAESQVLRDWAGSDKSFVMATGGGAPCFLKGMDVINQTGLSIFLDVPLVQLAERLNLKNDRPLLHAVDQEERILKLNALRENRLTVYNEAKIILKDPSLAMLMDAVRFRT